MLIILKTITYQNGNIYLPRRALQSLKWEGGGQWGMQIQGEGKRGETVGVNGILS